MNKRPHISIAPMMDWTDRHCRYFHRLLSPHARLYTEMVTTGALLHGDVDRHLRFNKEEHFVALQLGGSDPADLATAAKMGEEYGYDEINLNCGCPSERVQKGSFGACLMAEPELVAASVEAMTRAVKIPVTVKCRIGINNCEAAPFLKTFLTRVSDAGCKMFVIHARQAWLKGLSPKENREVPPLDYALVARMKQEFPHLEIVLNGGIKTLDEIKTHLASHSEAAPLPPIGSTLLQKAADDDGNKYPPIGSTLLQKAADDDGKKYDGVMIGREAYQNPSLLLDIERDIFKNKNVSSKQECVRAMIPYIEQQMRDFGTPMKSITRHMIGLFNGQRGSRAWRRALSVDTHADNATPEILLDALNQIEF